MTKVYTYIIVHNSVYPPYMEPFPSKKRNPTGLYEYRNDEIYVEVCNSFFGLFYWRSWESENRFSFVDVHRPTRRKD